MSPNPTPTTTYTHGHHASVLRSHTWRTATNSCAYLLPYLQPHMHILDIGCGPGTITADLAALVPSGSVTGLESASEVLTQARSTALQRGVRNVEFVTGDVLDLRGIEDARFDVVHAHQVLQHVADPVRALREMKRVTKSGGLVAARDSDYSAFISYPEVPGMKEWQELYLRVARSNGGEPDAGRRLHAWAKRAGFERGDVTATASTWCFNTVEEIEWWSGTWAERSVASSFAKTAVGNGIATQGDLERIARVWRDWGREEDAWFGILHGEIVCRVE